MIKRAKIKSRADESALEVCKGKLGLMELKLIK